jgi:hypothetical protein
MARLVITAVVVEGRRPAEVAATYGVSRSWVYELVARWRRDGDSAFEPRSRRPMTSPTAIGDTTVELIVTLRRRLDAQGLDAGADTIRWHLDTHHQLRVSRATIDRTCNAKGSSRPNHTSGPGRPTSASKPTSPTRHGSPTSPTTASPPVSMSRS